MLQGSSSLTPLLRGILWHCSSLGEHDNIADVPNSVQELCMALAVPCIPILPALGWGSSQGCRRPAETGQVGFAPVGSYSWGTPLVESSAPHLATAPLGFATLCLAGSPLLGLPTHTPTPPGAACGWQQQGWGWRDSELSPRAAAAAPTGELWVPLLWCRSRASLCCRLINFCHIKELAVCGQEAQSSLVGVLPPWILEAAEGWPCFTCSDVDPEECGFGKGGATAPVGSGVSPSGLHSPN